jgi:transcriptional regulator with XRE-family HTH domain
MTAPFGERIRALRKKKGLTLDQLAAVTESSKSYIWELENKNPPRPSAEKIAKIAAALDVTGDYLMGADDADLQTAEDKAFFRKYNQMTPDARARLRKLAKALDEDD